MSSRIISRKKALRRKFASGKLANAAYPEIGLFCPRASRCQRGMMAKKKRDGPAQKGGAARHAVGPASSRSEAVAWTSLSRQSIDLYALSGR